MENCYFVVLSGGSGERLWPLSRKSKPKQLIPFMQGKSMLEQMLDRLSLLATTKEQLGIVTTEQHAALINELVGSKYGFVIIEPTPRNTAAATILSCLQLYKKNPQAIVVVCPADHFIQDDQAFAAQVKAAIKLVTQEKVIATLGVVPTHPATGYGYIIPELVDAEIKKNWYSVQAFTEKPSLTQAKMYLEQGNVYWNIGVYVAQVSVMLAEIERCSPELYQAVVDYVERGFEYSAIPSTSIDYALAEKSNKMVVLPSDFTWSDVGNLNSFLAHATFKSAEIASIVINSGCQNNSAYAHKKAVAFVGVSDLCVVETDDVILVVKKSDAESVRALVQDIRGKKLDALL